MTNNPLHPVTPAKDAGSAPGTQSQSSRPTSAKTPEAAGRDDGARTFRSTPEAASTTSTRVGGSSEVLGYLNSIEEFVGKARKALSASSRDGTSQATERQSNESAPSPSNTGRTEQGASHPGNRSTPTKV